MSLISLTVASLSIALSGGGPGAADTMELYKLPKDSVSHVLRTVYSTLHFLYWNEMLI